MTIQELVNNLPAHQQKKVNAKILETAEKLSSAQSGTPVIVLKNKEEHKWSFDHLCLYFNGEAVTRELPEMVDVSHRTQMDSGAWASKEIWARPMFLIAPDGSYETTRRGHWFLPFNDGHPGFHPKNRELFEKEQVQVGRGWVAAFGSMAED
jgi:hypothetical protein